MTTASDPASVLEASACWTLLRAAVVGRLAVSVDGHPDIFPVNYVVDHGTVVFRTTEGTKLAALAGGNDVAFEVDGYRPEEAEAWSVVIKGAAAQVKARDLLDAPELPLFPWHTGPKPWFVRIVPTQISGRRFRVVDREAWRTPLTDAPRPGAPE